MKTVAIGKTDFLLSAPEEAKKSVLGDAKTVYELKKNLFIVCSGDKTEARIFSAYECGADFAPFHFVRDCLKTEADAAAAINGFTDQPLPVPEPCDTREGLGILEAQKTMIPDANRLTEAAKTAGFDGEFPDFEKKFVCKKAFISQGLALRYAKSRTLTAFVRFRGGEKGVSALCGATLGDPADAPLENKEVFFFDSLYFPNGDGDPADAFGWALLEDGDMIRFSRRIRPGRAVPAHLAAAFFWGLAGAAVLLPFALPAAVKVLPAAISLAFSLARLAAIKLSVKR